MLVTSGSLALADESGPAPPAARSDSRTFATFVVNSELRGEHIVVLKSDGVYAATEDLRAAGLSLPPRVERDVVGGYVRLADLAPEIEAVFDPQGPTVRLDAQSSASLTRDSNISVLPGQDLAGDARRDKSGYLNYSASLGTGAEWSTAQQLTLSDSSKTLTLAGNLGNSGFQRGLSNLTWDDDVRRHEVTVGDVVGDSGELGSSLILDGVEIARTFGSTPYAQTITSPTLSGTALTPSIADVYVNGQLIRSVNVPPGAFNFSNLPAASGANDAQIVLRDSFGHTQVLSSRYYGGNAMLRLGDSDYSYSIGEDRGTAGLRSSYAGIAAVGRYAVGLTRSTTVGGHGELSGGFENAGASFAHAGNLGIVNAGVAESRDRALSGLAATAGYTFSTARVWATASFQAATANYMTLAERGAFGATSIEKSIEVGLRPFRGSYTSSIFYSDSRSRLDDFSRQLSWQHTLQLGSGVSLMVSTGASETLGRSNPALSMFLIRSGGRNARDTETLSVLGDGQTLQPALELQHATPIAGGSGYDATLYPSGSLASSGRYSLRSSDGNVDVDYAVARDGALSGDVALSGAVAFAGGYAHLAQPIADGFALVKVDGGQRVNVLIDSQDYGTTDAKGMLVLPNVPSYYAERIGIESDGGPVNLDISSDDRNMVVAARHGAVVEFNASVVTAVIGKLLVSHDRRSTIPAFGQVSLASRNGAITSELDAEGRFYLEDLLPGTYAATIRYTGGECRFALAVPHSTAIEQNIGSFTCERS